MPEKDGAQGLDEAIAAGAARDYAKAVRILSSILAEGEAPVAALLYLGRSLHALGSTGRAVEAFRAYLRAGGERGAGHFFLGRALLASGLPAEAARALAESVASEPGSSSAWALLGAAELKLRKSQLAVQHLERAVGLAPEDRRIYRAYLNALFVQGVRSLAKGDPSLAERTFGFVIDNGLDSTATRLWRAKALRGLGRLPEALAESDAALSHSPGDPSIGWLRAGLLLALGRRDEALGIFSTLGPRGGRGGEMPGSAGGLDMLRAATAFAKGDWKEALASATAALREGGGPGGQDLPARTRASLHAFAALSLLELGQAVRARVAAERAIAEDPADPDLRINHALILWELGAYDEALRGAGEAQARGADAESVEYVGSLCRSKLGVDTERVLSRLQAILRLRAGRGQAPDARLLLCLGECLYRLERPDLAGVWFEKVLGLVPGHELALLYRISVAESLGDAEARERAYEAYLARYPDNGAIRREYAELLLDEEAWDRAATLLEAGLPWPEQAEGTRRLLARAFREAGRFRDATLLYRELLLDEPENGELLMALCLCHSKLGRTDFALDLLDKAPSSALEGAGPWIVRGILSERLGRIEAAIDSYRTASEREPRLARPWKELARLYSARGLDAFAEEALARAASLAPGGAGAGPGGRGRPKAGPARTTAAGKGAAGTKPSRSRARSAEGDIPKPRKPGS